MVAVPRKAVGMMLEGERGGQRVLGAAGRHQWGLEGSWGWGTGSVWQLEVGDGVCGGISYLGLMEMHICRRGPRLMPGRTELGVTRAILGAPSGPSAGFGVLWDVGGSPGAHLPVRKAKPTSIPSRFCSVSRLCGVAVSQTISPSAPRPVRSPNWESERQMRAGHCLTRVLQGWRCHLRPFKGPSPGTGGSPR